MRSVLRFIGIQHPVHGHNSHTPFALTWSIVFPAYFSGESEISEEMKEVRQKCDVMGKKTRCHEQGKQKQLSVLGEKGKSSCPSCL